MGWEWKEGEEGIRALRESWLRFRTTISRKRCVVDLSMWTLFWVPRTGESNGTSSEDVR